MKKSVLTGFVFSIVAFVLSLIAIIVSIHSISNATNTFEVSLSFIANSSLLNSSISIMTLILGCCLFIVSIIMISLTFKRIANKSIKKIS